MLYDKCETATGDVSKVTSTEAFNAEMDTFAKNMEENRVTTPNKPLVNTGNEDLDNLVGISSARVIFFNYCARCSFAI